MKEETSKIGAKKKLLQKYWNWPIAAFWDNGNISSHKQERSYEFLINNYSTGRQLPYPGLGLSGIILSLLQEWPHYYCLWQT